ncbi:aminoglycoside phosphotransferase family protein [Chlorobium sp. KB01]|uniref:aminoglycoside phosphotransferase family protein n=1 Tax=Chlorobium sp. KB01 TaxID=1917528 RepID=UPI000975F8D4|nr:phosphotransferase [Chlorobium sp. KB01]
MTITDNIASLFASGSRKSLSITKIQGDASSRQYFRVTAPGNTVIACYDPAFEERAKEEYAFLLMHALFSRNSIPVPEVIAVDEKKGLLLLEDCGDLLLKNLFGSPAAETIPDRYREIIRTLIRLQSICDDQKKIPFNISFDREKLMFEFDFFITHGLLDYFAPQMDPNLIGSLRHEFETIAAILVKPEHFVLNHRDFHSRNILIHQGKPVIIDFQDARMGLPQYDAVSLLRDSYVSLEPDLTEELKALHYHELRLGGITSMSFDEYLYYFDIMAFQRNIKAIGTFCYQTRVKKNRTFEHSIAPTLRYIPDYIDARSELKKAGKLLHAIIEENRQ